MEEITRNAESRVYPKCKARIYQTIKTPGTNSMVECQESHSRGWQSGIRKPKKYQKLKPRGEGMETGCR